jgi:nucleoside-diphosphate-sugar epimerase
MAAGKEILITGAAGFIGGEMARHFSSQGRSIAAFDLPGRPVAYRDLQGIRTFEGDITDPADCRELLKSSSPDVIVHCAAAMGGSTPREEFMRVNLGGTRNLAEAAIASGIRRFIFISSVTVHGMPPRPGIDESSPIKSIGLPYADSKIATEAALLDYQNRGQLDVTILRPADVYGPRSGEWVVKLVHSLREGKMILIGGGRGLVNLTYVDNLSDATAACIERDESIGESYLVSDGEPVTWKKYLAALSRACGAKEVRISIPEVAAWPLVYAMEAVFPLLGRKPPLGKLGLRLITSRSAYDISKAREGLDWYPAVSFDEGMTKVADWIQKAMPA